jgi:hypothetical protein
MGKLDAAVTYTGQILALDLAARTGWARGRPGDRVPFSGSVRFGKEGSSMACVLSGCRGWLDQHLNFYPGVQLVVFEAPLLPSFKRGKTNIHALRQLNGLTSVVEELLYTRGTYDVREARVADIRNHFLGSNRFKREIAKAKTIERCRLLGWDPVDDNAADALALWHYQTSQLKEMRIVG